MMRGTGGLEEKKKKEKKKKEYILRTGSIRPKRKYDVRSNRNRKQEREKKPFDYG
jgi:hypothetical protein